MQQQKINQMIQELSPLINLPAPKITSFSKLKQPSNFIKTQEKDSHINNINIQVISNNIVTNQQHNTHSFLDIHDASQNRLKYPKVRDLDVKKDWLVKVPEDKYKQNVLTCTRLAAVRIIQEKNIQQQSNLFKLAHLRSETAILQQNTKLPEYQNSKIKQNQTWNIIAQKQGTNFFKKIFQRKCIFGFDKIVIQSDSKKENIILDPYKCQYKIERPTTKDNDTMFPWIQNSTCRIILTAPNQRKFALYINKIYDAKHIVQQIGLKRACQDFGKYAHLMQKCSLLYKKKVIVASSEKLSQNGKFSQFRKQEEQKLKSHRKQIMIQQSQMFEAQKTSLKNIKKYQKINNKTSNINSQINMNLGIQTGSAIKSPSPNTSQQLDSPTKRPKGKHISPLLKVRPVIQHLQPMRQMQDLSLSKMMQLKVKSTIDTSYVQPLHKSRIQQAHKHQLILIEQNQEEKDKSRKGSYQTQDLLLPITPPGQSKKRRKSFFYKDDNNQQLLLQQFEVHEQLHDFYKGQNQNEVFSISSNASLPKNVKLDIFITIIGMQLFVKHYDKKINLDFIQSIDPETETLTSKAVQFRRNSFTLHENSHNPLMFNCDHQCLTYSSISNKFKISLDLPDKHYVTNAQINMFSLPFQKCSGQVIYFKQAPIAGYLMYLINKTTINPIQQLHTVQYLANHINDYQKRYRMVDINQTRSLLRLQFHQKTWQYLDKKRDQDFFEKLVYSGVPQKFKKKFFQSIPEINLKQQNLTYQQCRLILNTLSQPFRDKLTFGLNSKFDCFMQIASFKGNSLLKDRIKCLISYYEFKSGSAQTFLIALTYTIVSRLRVIIMKLKSKYELQNLVKLYLDIEYELDELFQDVYSYMHRK